MLLKLHIRFAITLLGILLLTACSKEPLAFFAVDSTSALKTGIPVKMINYSIDADSYAWDFGDGTTSTEEQPEHTYTQPGTYTIKLTASSKNGKKDNTQIKSVTITVNTNPMFVGTYDVTDNCSGSSEFYAITITETGNNLALLNLKNAGIQLTAQAFDNNLSIPAQNVLYLGVTYSFSGSAQYFDNQLTGFYNMTDGFLQISCSFTAQKQ
jgi:PKD repeat protein